MTRTLLLRPWLAAALLGLSLGALAQSPAAPTISPGDRRFVQMSAMGGMAEVELGRMGQQRGSDPQVKALGARIAHEHTQANAELMRLGTAKGVPMPTSLDAEHKRHAERLGALAGSDFDNAYVQHVIDDHKADIDAFDIASRTAADGEIKAFATRTLPTLQVHLQMAQTAAVSVRSARAVEVAKPASATSR